MAGDQTTKSWWIAASDYGKQVAQSFRVDDVHDENRECPIQGPEPYSMEEAIDQFIKHYPGKILKKAKAPMWVFNLLKPFSASIDFQYHILTALNQYDEQFQSQQTWDTLGKPTMTLADWAEKQA
jgi:hypothetical protein